jgi:hypothetical protein
MGDSDDDEAPLPPANDAAVRSRITVLLGDAVDDPSPLFDLARSIESALFQLHSSVGLDTTFHSIILQSKHQSMTASM